MRRSPFALALCLASCASGATTSPPAATVPLPGDSRVVLGERLGLRSEVLGEERVVLVQRPPPIPGRDAGGHPVVYLLDGDDHFVHATGLMQFLAGQGRMPRVMVVGIGNVNRTRDFTPTPDPGVPNSGGADRFLSFLEQELIPAAERGLASRPYRILVGHSFGALLAIHALTRRPDLFDAYICISPSLFWADSLMEKQTRALFAARPELDKTVYLAVGNEVPAMVTSNRAYADFLRAGAPRALRWRFEEMKDEDHGSIVHRGIYRGLEHVFDGWRLPTAIDTLGALEAHHHTLATRFRLPYELPEFELNIVAYRMLAAGRVDDAVAAFRKNVALHPDSANVHDSLGEALEQKGDRAGALQSYELAVKTAAANRDPLLELFMKNLDRARARTGAE